MTVKNLTAQYLVMASVLAMTGCTQYLYQADFEAIDDSGDQRAYRFYWTETSPFIGGDRAGPGVLQAECRTAKTFTETSATTPIVLELGSDKFQSETLQAGPSINCGAIENLNLWRDYAGGDLTMTISCVPTGDEFDAVRESLPALGSYALEPQEKDKKTTFLKASRIEPPPFDSASCN